MSGHAVLAPSSAARRVACTGSRALESLYKETESESAREGTVAHRVASGMLKNLVNNLPALTDYGSDATEEMIEHASAYCALIMDVVHRGTPCEIHIEERVDIKTIHPECWGTPDCWFYADGHLRVWDYKYGHGVVEVFENWQLIEYVAGILDSLGIAESSNECKITFYIVQPRAFHRDGIVRAWDIRIDDLRGYFDLLRTKEAESLSPDARCTPSPQCAYCKARHACVALQRSALSIVEMTKGVTPWDLNAAETGNELRYLLHASQLLDARITGLSAQALVHLRQGERVPHFKTEETACRERWSVSAEEVAVLGRIYNCDLTKSSDVLTPKQAIKAGVDADVVKYYSDTPRGAVKLVADNGSAARKIFGNKR